MVISDVSDYADINDLIDLLNKDLSYYGSDGRRYYEYQIVTLATGGHGVTAPRLGLEREFIDNFEDLKLYLESSKSCHVPETLSLRPSRQDSGFDPVEDDEKENMESDSEIKAEIIFLRQKHSKSRLAISEQALDLLLSRYGVFPDFMNVLTSLTMEDGPYNEGRSGFYHTSLRFTAINSVTFGDLQNIHNLADLLLRLTQVLKLNLEVLRLFSKELQNREEFDNAEAKWRYKLLESAIDSSISENTFICKHAELVRSRADSIVGMKIRDQYCSRN
ncbi:hypothetical protein BDZ45DRAFT_748681 [Acephala macrosclerotiorum]|nr:hypothetical protein BDZ45DRAFT_748681 [Acephala macrosclerotiorum]